MNNDVLMGTLTGLALMIPYAGIGLLTFVLADWWLGVREKVAVGAKIKEGNVALGLRRLGLFIAIGIGLSGVYTSESPNLINDLRDSALYALALVVMMHVALKLNDIVVLPGVPNSMEVNRGNTAVAATEVGSMIATGFIAKAAVSGEDGGFLIALAFFVLGQLALALSVRCYAFFRRKCRIINQVEGGNTAAGIVLGTKFFAYGLVLSTAIAGPFTTWADSLGSFALTAIGGLVFLLVVDWLVDLILVRWYTLQELIDQNSTGSALVFAGGKIGMAYVISTLLL